MGNKISHNSANCVLGILRSEGLNVLKDVRINLEYHKKQFLWVSRYGTQESEYIQQRIYFPLMNATLRTNESFLNKVDEQYHKGDSPLKFLSIDMINDVCLYYMHNVCIGITKRLIQLWINGGKT